MLKRTFILGDSWCYYKLYTGFKEADNIIKDTLLPVANYLLDNKFIDGWFFIRYTDPKFHLRFRFHVKDDRGLIKSIMKLNEELQYYISNDIIWKVQIDTYQREIERYGEEVIELSERIFFYDSNMIAKILNMDINDKERELISFKIIDSFLNVFKIDDQDKLSILRELQLGYKNEYNIKGTWNDQFSNKYRELRKNLEDILSQEPKNVNIIKYLDLIKEKELIISSIPLEISNLLPEEKFQSFLKSHIHMMINRLFRTQQRIYELVIYDCLSRYYSSFLARNK